MVYYVGSYEKLFKPAKINFAASTGIRTHDHQLHDQYSTNRVTEAAQHMA